MRRFVDLVFIAINAFAPLVGVIWFGWDITEVVFLYTIEAGCTVLYHLVVYGHTYHHLTDPQLKQGYLGTALLRLLFEATLTVAALTLLVDAVTGYRTTIFDDFGVVLDYLWVTIVPTLTLCAQYSKRIANYWQQRSAQPITQVSALGFWLFTLPLPAFIYSYILATNHWSTFIILLILVAVIKLIVEVIQFLKRDQLPFPIASEPTVLQSAPYSAQAIITTLWSYILIGVGFLAVNPFTHDPKYTLLENMLIYFGFALVVSPFLIPRRITLTLNTAAKQIEIDQRWFTSRRRIIPLADIVRVTTKQNTHKVIYLYQFKLRDGSVWKCTNSTFNPTDWHAWMKQVQAL